MISLKLKIKRIKLIVVTCILFILIGVGLKIFLMRISDRDKPVCKNCNVILISLDTLGSNHLPCYGYERNTATNLCNFAEENIYFTNSFSNAGWTLPSHLSIFTSLYPNHHNMLGYELGVPFDQIKLNTKILTIAEYFRNAKYKTTYVGPLDDKNLPTSIIGRGFDSLINMKSQWSLAEWQESIDQLKNNNDNKSTFLFLHSYWVHDPYFVDYVSEGNARKYTDDYYADIPLNFDFLDSLNIAITGGGEDQVLNNFKDNSTIKNPNLDLYLDVISKMRGRVQYTEALYDEMINYLDKQLSMIFDLVSNSRLADNTIIIFTSDHGDAFLEHGMMRHPADHLYNTTTSVPLIMYVPGVNNRKIDSMVQGIDILPTLLNLTGINKQKQKFDGIDLTGLILGKPDAKKNDFLISEGSNGDSIRDNQWKLYIKGNALSGNKTYELYDLLNDPMEQLDQSSQNPQIIKSLEENLNRIIYKY